MYLKEIEMDLPYVENNENIRVIQEMYNLDYNHAVRRDYDLKWKEKRRKFQLMTRCMTSMIERIMPKITTKDCWKILIECVGTSPISGFRNMLGVYTLQTILDVESFFQLNDYEKKKHVINTIFYTIRGLMESVEFDLSVIIKSCNKIVDYDYINEWFWKKPIKLKQCFAQIKIIHEVNEVNIYMIFYGSGNEIMKQIKIITTPPDEREYSQYLGQLECMSYNSVKLITKNGEIFIYCYDE